MHLSKDAANLGGFLVFVLCYLVVPCYTQNGQWRGTNNNMYRRSNGSPAVTTNNCEYKELMTTIHDRVGVLATLDEYVRKGLDNINTKITQFEARNLNILESLGVQQTDFKKQLDSMSYTQLQVKNEVNSLKEATRVVRQAVLQPRPEVGAEDNIDTSQKLEALSRLLLSTNKAVYDLQMQVSRLLGATRRQNTGAGFMPGSGHGLFYVPPPPSIFSPDNSQQKLITSCAQGAPTSNGILKLQLTPTSEPFYVFCDEKYANGGWTVILNRYNGTINFQRGWLEYKTGFGNLAGDFFIGLDKLHALTTSAVHELVVVIEDFEGQVRHANYDVFAIGNEEEDYAMKLLGAYEGTAGDSLSYHAGSKFSTFDNDNDGCLDCNCALGHMGAWWYNRCDKSNLNGVYYGANNSMIQTYTGIYWHTFRGGNYSLKAVRMMIRPVEVMQPQFPDF